MTVVNLTTSSWVQINTSAQRIQVVGGRIQVADSATPGVNDYIS